MTSLAGSDFHLSVWSFCPSLRGFGRGKILQVNQQLIQRVFRMRTSVSRLKSDVAKLGGPQDTVELRKSVAAAISKIQDDAQNIKGQLLQVAPEHKNRQTAKILTDFEVSPMAPVLCWPSLHTFIISILAVPDLVMQSPLRKMWSKTVIEINTAVV